jgi:hypothetical protein
VLNYAVCHEDIWGSGGIGPPFFISRQIIAKQNYHRRVLKYLSVLSSGNNTKKKNNLCIRYTISAKYVEEF